MEPGRKPHAESIRLPKKSNLLASFNKPIMIPSHFTSFYPRKEGHLMRFSKFGILLGCLILGIASCESDPVGKRVHVKGTVKVGGTPLESGSIAFWPDNAKGNKSPYEAGATIGSGGSFELFTFSKAGIPPGAYKVTVISQGEADNINPTKIKSLVPEKYTDKTRTDYVVEIKDQPNQEITVDLTK
jgi:hypothetical protein